MKEENGGSSPTQQNSNGVDPRITAIFESISKQIAELTHKVVEKLPEQSEWERKTRVVTDFPRIQPLTYDGGVDVEEAEDWVCAMEKIFRLVPYDEPTKVRLAESMLEGDAYAWWLSTKESAGEVGSWERFKELFLQRYFPRVLRYRKLDEFLHLEQGDMTVMEYALEFERLIWYANRCVTSEEDKIYQFVHGLRPSIQAKMCGGGKEFETTVYTAQMLENYEEEADREPELPNRSNKRMRSDATAFQGQGGSRVVTCFNCGEVGHKRWKCPHS